MAAPIADPIDMRAHIGVRTAKNTSARLPCPRTRFTIWENVPFPIQIENANRQIPSPAKPTRVSSTPVEVSCVPEFKSQTPNPPSKPTVNRSGPHPKGAVNEVEQSLLSPPPVHRLQVQSLQSTFRHQTTGAGWGTMDPGTIQLHMTLVLPILVSLAGSWL